MFTFRLAKTHSNSINKVQVDAFQLNGRFDPDSIHHENDGYQVLLHGVVLNKKDLMSEFNASWIQTIWSMCEKYGDTFFTKLKGSFNGFVFDKRKGKLLVFTNLQGDQPVFYMQKQEEYIFSSHIAGISKAQKNANLRLKLSEQGAYMLLTHGYMLEDHTLYKNVKRLRTNYYIIIENSLLTLHQYFNFSFKIDKNKKLSDYIENWDNLFRKAINLQFEKDIEYGYRHFVALSGGLDSRMTSWVAHEMGYTNQLNFTFAQTGSGDESIPKQIAAYLCHPWLFKSLDNGNYLLNLDETTLISEGNSVYYGIAHGRSLTELLTFDNFGISHSGQLGDVILATDQNKFDTASIKKGAYSTRLLSKLDESSFDFKAYQNDLEFKYLNRYINGTNYGLAGIRDKTYSISPFYDTEVWELACKIPLELRHKHFFYKKWMLKRYPQSADFIYDKTNLRPKYNFFKDKKIIINGRGTDIREQLGRAYREFARRANLPYQPSLKGMNPHQAWYITNPRLNKFINQYLDEHICLLDDFHELQRDSLLLFQNGNVEEKLQVLSLLSAAKMFMN